MKKLLLTLSLLLAPLTAYGANSATALTPVDISIGGCNLVTPVTVIFDTSSEDLTIYTPNSNRYAAVVGLFISGGTLPIALTVKSGSTTLAAWAQTVVPATTMIPIKAPLVMTNKGEALVMSVSNVANQMMVYVAECSEWTFDN